ncbi:hypothetical protein BKA70DRAFT_1558959 [Coprinopsis sp. MPI-PUGE-AT-0042]|nr:hypothetical protein BKA70DRAFT_1558959 [Coprinopsis sp. MPI-PUGE-AT-0042]
MMLRRKDGALAIEWCMSSTTSISRLSASVTGPSGEPTSGLHSSFEEVSFKAFEATKAGNSQEYMSSEAAHLASAENNFTSAQASLSQVFETAEGQPGGHGPATCPRLWCIRILGSISFRFSAMVSRIWCTFNDINIGFERPQPPPLASVPALAVHLQLSQAQPLQPSVPETLSWDNHHQRLTRQASQPATGQSAFGTSAQPRGGSSLIKPTSGFGARAGGGTNVFGSAAASIATTNPPAGGGGSASPSF